MSVARNFVVGAEPMKGRGPFRRIDMEKASEIAISEMRKLGIRRVTDGRRLVGSLSGGERQALAIGRAMHFGARVLVLDEPTAALGVRESAERPSASSRRPGARGVAVLFITHNAYHANETGDRFVVLRRGEALATFNRGEMDIEEFLSLMAGGEELRELMAEEDGPRTGLTHGRACRDAVSRRGVAARARWAVVLAADDIRGRDPRALWIRLAMRRPPARVHDPRRPAAGDAGRVDLPTTPVLVRVEHPASLVIHRALDAGARGIIFPTIETGEQATRCRGFVPLPPSWRRSWGPARLSSATRPTPESANTEALCIVMIESRRALENLDDILSVTDVDGVLAGPSDLAIDLGLPPSPLPIEGRHRRALADDRGPRGRAEGVAGGFRRQPEGVHAFRELGYVMFGVGNDAGLLDGGAAPRGAAPRRRRVPLILTSKGNQ